jgi:hypothetical protein
MYNTQMSQRPVVEQSDVCVPLMLTKHISKGATSVGNWARTQDPGRGTKKMSDSRGGAGAQAIVKTTIS